MKLTICLSLLALISLVSCQTADESNFLVSYAWEVISTVPANLTGVNCCMPGGLIYMNSDKYSTDQVLLNATQWNGELCAELYMNSDFYLIFPFSNTSSYNQLVADGDHSAPLEGETVIYNIGNYSDIDGVVTWSLGINFEATTDQGGICSVTLSTADPTLESSSISAQPTANDPNFLIMFWYAQATTPANLTDVDCCMPGGIVSMVPDSTGQISLSANEWNGALCADLGLSWEVSLTFPFSNTSSFNELVRLVDQPVSFKGETLIFSIGNYSYSDEDPSWSFSINFEETSYAGGICSVSLIEPFTP